jgi:CHASE2 domain-containing sensor protein
VTHETIHGWQLLLTLGVAGLVTGLGNLLASDERLTKRIVIGRALSSAALGVTAGMALAYMPSIPFVAQVGLACALASLGTSGLERIFQRFMGTKTR